MSPDHPFDPRDLIERIGSSVIAKAFGISDRAVRKWRHGSIPADRLDQLLELARKRGLVLSTTTTTSLSLDVPHGSAAGTSEVAPRWSAGTRQRVDVPPDAAQPQAPDGTWLVPQQKPEPSAIVPVKAVPEPAKVIIAERDVAFAQVHAKRLADRAEGLPPAPPVPGYVAWLTLLAALDLPALTAAFMSVSQVAPAVAACSAAGFALFSMLGGHKLGGSLRQVAPQPPAWLPGLIGLLCLSAYLAAIVFVTIELRELALDAAELAATDGALIFGADEPATMPATFKRAIVATAALVNVGALMFAIALSWSWHSPLGDFARAECAYRKSLLKLERTRQRYPVAAMAAAALLSVAGSPADAAECPGPTVLALVDTTTGYDEVDRGQIIPAIETMAASLEAGERLIIRTVRHRPEASRLLLDECVPAIQQGWLAWLLTSPADRAGERRAFFRRVREVLVALLSWQYEAPASAIATTLAVNLPADDVGCFPISWKAKPFSPTICSPATPASSSTGDQSFRRSVASPFTSPASAAFMTRSAGRSRTPSKPPCSTLGRSISSEPGRGWICSGDRRLVANRIRADDGDVAPEEPFHRLLDAPPARRGVLFRCHITLLSG